MSATSLEALNNPLYRPILKEDAGSAEDITEYLGALSKCEQTRLHEEMAKARSHSLSYDCGEIYAINIAPSTRGPCSA